MRDDLRGNAPGSTRETNGTKCKQYSGEHGGHAHEKQY